MYGGNQFSSDLNILCRDIILQLQIGNDDCGVYMKLHTCIVAQHVLLLCVSIQVCMHANVSWWAHNRTRCHMRFTRVGCMSVEGSCPSE